MKPKNMFIVGLLLCFLFICSCDIKFSSYNKEYWDKKKQGFYPKTKDIPCTKWECAEADIYFYFLDNGEPTIVGEYNDGKQSFRLIGDFFYERLDFNFYSSTNISSSNKNGFIHCDTIRHGFVYTNYKYEKDVITCTITNSDVIGFKGKTLTFKKTATIAQTPNIRWRCSEIDMYLDEFSDIEGYYKGEIIINGCKNLVQAFEIGNDNYYMFSIENGKINNLIEGSTSPLVCMLLEHDKGKIVGKISDEHLVRDEIHLYWDFKETTLTFTKETKKNTRDGSMSSKNQ